MSEYRCTTSRLCKNPGVLVAGSRLTPCLKHLAKKKERKYRNRPEWSELVGRRFDSAGERGYCEARYAESKAGIIHRLRFQTTWKLEVNGLLVATYRSDADWRIGSLRECKSPLNAERCDCPLKVADWKGYETPEFRLKAKLFRAVMGFDIEVVRPERNSFGPKRGRR